MFRNLVAWHIRYRSEPGCKGCRRHVRGKFFSERSERPEKISEVLYIIKGERRYSAITQEVREHSNEQERIETLYVDEISITQKRQSWYRPAFSDWNRVFKASVTVRFDKVSEDIYKRLVRSGMQWKICGTTARYISPTNKGEGNPGL